MNAANAYAQEKKKVEMGLEPNRNERTELEPSFLKEAEHNRPQ